MAVIIAIEHPRDAASRYDSTKAFGTPMPAMPKTSSLSVSSPSGLVLDKTTSDS